MNANGGTCDAVDTGSFTSSSTVSMDALSADLNLNIPLHCINMATSTDRRASMERECQRLAIVPIFNTAVTDHRGVNYDTKLGKRCYCVTDCKHRKRKLRPVEVAIAMSHYQVYLKISEHESVALICEDDIVFHDDFISIANKLLATIEFQLRSENPVIVFFGGYPDNPNLQLSNQSISRTVTGSYSNYCYLLNRAAASVLIQNFFPITRPEDSYKRYLIAQGKIQAYQIRPSLVAELSMGVNMPAKFARLSRNF